MIENKFLPGAASSPSLMLFSRLPAISLYLEKQTHGEAKDKTINVLSAYLLHQLQYAGVYDVKQHCVR